MKSLSGSFALSFAFAAVGALAAPSIALAEGTRASDRPVDPLVAPTAGSTTQPPAAGATSPSTSDASPPPDSPTTASSSALAPQDADTETVYQAVRPNKPLLYTGGIMLLGSYATTAAVTAASDGTFRDTKLYIPVVGPWLHIGNSTASRTDTTMDTVLVVGSGVFQGVGASLLIASLFIPERVPTATVRAGNTLVHFAPTSFGVGSAGMGAIGTF